MLVSLSLSPASTAAKNDKHWAFLVRLFFLMFFLIVLFLTSLIDWQSYVCRPILIFFGNAWNLEVELFEIIPACGILTVLSVLSMQAEIDAPQWADLRAEEALAGTIGYVFDTLSLLSL